VETSLLGVLFASFTAYADPTASSGESPGIVPDGTEDAAPAETSDPGSTAPKTFKSHCAMSVFGTGPK